MTNLTSVWGVQHPNPGQNIQQMDLTFLPYPPHPHTHVEFFDANFQFAFYYFRNMFYTGQIMPLKFHHSEFAVHFLNFFSIYSDQFRVFFRLQFVDLSTWFPPLEPDPEQGLEDLLGLHHLYSLHLCHCLHHLLLLLCVQLCYLFKV